MYERFQLRDRALPVVAGVLLALGLPPAPVSAQVQGKEQQLCISSMNPGYDFLRDDPRFIELMHRAGLRQ